MPLTMRRTFDADGADRAAIEEPLLTIGRFRYRGRVLSMAEWLPFYEQALAVDAMPDGPAQLRAYHQLYVRFLAAVFPTRRYSFWAPNPVKALARAPGRTLEEAFARFFSHQLRMLRLHAPEPTTPPTAPTTNGPPWPDAIADDEIVLGV